MSNVESAAPEETASPLLSQYIGLNNTSQAIIKESLGEGRLLVVAKSHAFLTDISDWLSVLEPYLECSLLRASGREYHFALLAVAQGFYREAFACLRVALELGIATVFYSTNELLLREWMAGKRDNIWRKFLHPDKGIFSLRFADAFCADIRDDIAYYGTIATKLYRECSEYVHANAITYRALPLDLSFEESLFAEWHRKASSMHLIISFVLFVRYFDELPRESAMKVERTIVEYLGHLEPVRIRLQAIIGGIQ